MDVLGVNHHQIIKSKQHKNKISKKGIKVVYISSPMKVKTCASNFRALVQELTGKDSDADASAARFLENPSPNKLVDDQEAVVNDHSGASIESSSPTVSGSDMELFDDLTEGSFFKMLSSDIFNESSSLFQFNNYPMRSFDSM
ncbi:sigma factor binding protein 2, chloroplastic-like [Mangifera indica]|uniref:sigma factor binding protein 2, chloroplastic-like n=1 Tax=Mangifera indica TaxID=29780 RepID=UPI001CFA432F|nr:sigma factor binding protein 2, chloroplastic-like [Mangifera indica]